MSPNMEKSAHILLIEDNPAESELLKYAFDQLREPYELTVLEDGEEALHFVQERGLQRPVPCVIVLDLGLPKYDGLTVLRAIKAEPDLAHIKIVVLTSGVSPKTEALVLKAGVNLFRTKPSSLEQVLALAAEILALCNAGLSTSRSAEAAPN
jgi:two-component system response regulator